MDLGLCFSGGKDSTLAGLLADPFFDLTLVTVSFGVTDAHIHARRIADIVSIPHQTLELDRSIAEEAIERMVADGYPREGIQYVHEQALEALATESFDAVGDGTRRDDRAPTISRPFAQSLEDRHDIEYVAPLVGYGRGAVDRLVSEHLEIETAPSESLAKGDYEHELRALIDRRHGQDTVENIFPDHTQSVVRGLR